MNKDRLAAFTDAILAIIMTILVLELENPAEASWAAVWELRQSFASYIISFFWLGAMWVNLHSQWQRIDRIDNRVVWCSIIMLFFASLFPWVTDFVGKNFMSRFANGAYLVVVLAVSFANIVLNRFVGEANREDRDFYNETKSVDRIMWIDIAIKVVGFGIAKHERAIGAWTQSTVQSFINFPLMQFVERVSPRPILMIAGENSLQKTICAKQ